MNLDNYYWYFESALSDKQCDDILEYIKTTSKKERAKIGIGTYAEEDYQDIVNQRNSDVSWLAQPWFYQILNPYIRTANTNAGWNFEWDWSEVAQFTHYKKGQFYNWHNDDWGTPYCDAKEYPDSTYGTHHQNYWGKIRKISTTIQLTDPKKYGGGNLEFSFGSRPDKKASTKLCTEFRPRGSIVTFPSFVHHRITKVTRGERNSLVCWSLGQPWR
jgi:PKHD-type hydroxylase